MTTMISRPGHDFTPGAAAEPHVAAMFAKGVLSRDELRRKVPSVFAASARDDVSAKYRFVPTIEIVDVLADQGFFPVRAEQTLVRREGGAAFATHMLRFRHADFLTMAKVGDELPELVLKNSHDRSCAVQLHLGIFRLVCSNGAVCSIGDMGGFSVKHVGGPDFSKGVIDATFQVVDQTPAVLNKIEAWKGIELTSPQKHAFAKAALELKENKPILPGQLLAPKRMEDRKGDLWTTSQVIQEHLMRGGDRGRNATGRRTTTRPIKSVNEDMRTNKALWRLTEEMAKLVG